MRRCGCRVEGPRGSRRHCPGYLVTCAPFPHAGRPDVPEVAHRGYRDVAGGQSGVRGNHFQNPGHRHLAKDGQVTEVCQDTEQLSKV